MKKAISLALLMVLAIGLVAYGCGGSDGTATTTTSPAGGQTTATTQPTTTQPTTTSQSSGDGFSWDDIPVYTGADSVQQASWSIPPAEGEYARVEWRYYETGASLDDVADFYQSEMPDNGWNEQGNMNTPMMKWFVYTKNNENDSAMIWVSSDGNQTIFALMRATK
jgi:hypothetical protein